MKKPLDRVAKRLPKPPPKLADGARKTAFELWALAREMLRIPAQLFMRAAELAGGVVLGGWRVVWPLLERAWVYTLVAFAFAQRVLTPARATLAVAAVAAIGLAASQFADYRSISIGTGDYAGVAEVAPPPELESATESAGSAHAWAGLPLGIAALALVAGSVRRWQLARLLPAIGVVVVAISFVVDRPKGLDEGDAALAYEGAEATLLSGFWVQLICGLVLMALAPLITMHLRPGAADPRPGAGGGPRLRMPRWRASGAGT